jgi:hypothetical protein
MIEFHEDGSYIFIDDNDPTRTQVFNSNYDKSNLSLDYTTFNGTPIPPTELPMYKVRKYLIMSDLIANVEAFLNALPEPNKSLALVDWEYAPNLVVNSPLALGAKTALNLTDSQYVQFVIAANNLA